MYIYIYVLVNHSQATSRPDHTSTTSASLIFRHRFSDVLAKEGDVMSSFKNLLTVHHNTNKRSIMAQKTEAWVRSALRVREICRWPTYRTMILDINCATPSIILDAGGHDPATATADSNYSLPHLLFSQAAVRKTRGSLHKIVTEFGHGLDVSISSF